MSWGGEGVEWINSAHFVTKAATWLGWGTEIEWRCVQSLACAAVVRVLLKPTLSIVP